MKLEEFKVYNRAMDIGEKVFKIVDQWDYFHKDTIGKQLVRSIDSVAANLSEGFGRYHYKETKNFTYYSRGSLYESRTLIEKGYKRGQITESDYKNLVDEIEVIGRMINSYINSFNKNLLKEPISYYGLNTEKEEPVTNN
jgi:four helix bundle protein